MSGQHDLLRLGHVDIRLDRVGTTAAAGVGLWLRRPADPVEHARQIILTVRHADFQLRDDTRRSRLPHTPAGASPRPSRSSRSAPSGSGGRRRRCQVGRPRTDGDRRTPTGAPARPARSSCARNSAGSPMPHTRHHVAAHESHDPARGAPPASGSSRAILSPAATPNPEPGARGQPAGPRPPRRPPGRSCTLRRRRRSDQARRAPRATDRRAGATSGLPPSPRPPPRAARRAGRLAAAGSRRAPAPAAPAATARARAAPPVGVGHHHGVRRPRPVLLGLVAAAVPPEQDAGPHAPPHQLPREVGRHRGLPRAADRDVAHAQRRAAAERASAAGPSRRRRSARRPPPGTPPPAPAAPRGRAARPATCPATRPRASAAPSTAPHAASSARASSAARTAAPGSPSRRRTSRSPSSCARRSGLSGSSSGSTSARQRVGRHGALDELRRHLPPGHQVHHPDPRPPAPGGAPAGTTAGASGRPPPAASRPPPPPASTCRTCRGPRPRRRSTPAGGRGRPGPRRPPLPGTPRRRWPPPPPAPRAGPAAPARAASRNAGQSRTTSWRRLPGNRPSTGRDGSRPSARLSVGGGPRAAGGPSAGGPTNVVGTPRSVKNASSNGRMTASRDTVRAICRTRRSPHAHSCGAM